MADSGEIKIDLRKIEDNKQGFVIAKVTWKHYQGKATDEHRVKHVRLAKPWEEWKEAGNRLEPAWQDPPQGLPEWLGEVFKIVRYTVGQGKNGKKDVKWSVWDESKHLTPNEKELYSVMRAEYNFINEGYRKCCSKYFRGDPSRDDPYDPFYGENYGVDSFFLRGKRGGGSTKCIICESKFTEKKAIFDKWMAKKKKPKERHIWSSLTKSKSARWVKQYPQMSWEWIRDRVAKAVDKPAGSLLWDENNIGRVCPKKKARLREELSELEQQVTYSKERRHVKRYVNYFGAERVPIYPGRYHLITLARNRITKEVLHLEWNLKDEIDFEGEFIRLGNDFDIWSRRVARNSNK